MRTSRPLAERLWDMVHYDENGCWIFNGPNNGKYGVIGVGGRGSGSYYAHRAAWIVTNGNIPDGMCVCHRCDVMLCVNPEHLFLGTQAENMADKVSKGLHLIGHRKKVSDSDVVRIRGLVDSGMSQASVARMYGISFQHVHSIVKGIRRAHV